MVYTDYQRLELEKEFHLSHYITIKRKAELALQLNLTERQVSINPTQINIQSAVCSLIASFRTIPVMYVLKLF